MGITILHGLKHSPFRSKDPKVLGSLPRMIIRMVERLRDRWAKSLSVNRVLIVLISNIITRLALSDAMTFVIASTGTDRPAQPLGCD